MSELQFEFSSFHIIIILLIIAGLSGYFYYELNNIKNIISEINKKIQHTETKENNLSPVESQITPLENQDINNYLDKENNEYVNQEMQGQESEGIKEELEKE